MMTTRVIFQRVGLPQDYACHKEAQEAQDLSGKSLVLPVPLCGTKPGRALSLVMFK